MQQFEAADKFLELVCKHPDDFNATHDTGRDHSYYLISHKYRAVSFCINDTHAEVTFSPSGLGFKFASKDTVKELLGWAIQRIEEDKVQSQVDLDNKAINELEQYYESKGK